MKDLTKQEAFALASPIPYVVVTSLDKNNKPNMMGVGWVTRTSWEPFLILVSIDHKRYSHDGIKLHKEFVVNYPSKNQIPLSWLAGTKSGRDSDKISAGKVELIDSLKVKVPTIKDVTVAFECVTVSEHVTGDHTVFVGEVVATRGNPDSNATLFCTARYQIISLDGFGVLQKP